MTNEPITDPAPPPPFAENQPFTPLTHTVRRHLANLHVGGVGITAIVWCLVITPAAYLWAQHLYSRREAK